MRYIPPTNRASAPHRLGIQSLATLLNAIITIYVFIIWWWLNFGGFELSFIRLDGLDKPLTIFGIALFLRLGLALWLATKREPDFITTVEKDPTNTYGIVFDWTLITIGLILLFTQTSYELGQDGVSRVTQLKRMFDYGLNPQSIYPSPLPLLTAPAWILGKISGDPIWLIARFNFFLFAIGLVVFYQQLTGRVRRDVARRFLLILVIGSMFPAHQRFYYAEIFTTVLVWSGVMAVAWGNAMNGWALAAVGAINQPAILVGYGLSTLWRMITVRKLVVATAPVVTAALFYIERAFRHGDPTYVGVLINKGLETIMPYSGSPGFSYPLFFGVISILFSFGKGLLFFTPGLLLVFRVKEGELISKEVVEGLRLVMIIILGMILVYGKWWSWYGGVFWGPRFFLLASVPASLALALFLADSVKCTSIQLVTGLIILALSIWVGTNGALFSDAAYSVCMENDYALEMLCWYTPEYSVLWHPLIYPPIMLFGHWLILAYALVVFVWLASPLVKELYSRGRDSVGQIKQRFKLDDWDLF